MKTHRSIKQQIMNLDTKISEKKSLLSQDYSKFKNNMTSTEFLLGSALLGYITIWVLTSKKTHKKVQTSEDASTPKHPKIVIESLFELAFSPAVKNYLNVLFK